MHALRSFLLSLGLASVSACSDAATPASANDAAASKPSVAARLAEANRNAPVENTPPSSEFAALLARAEGGDADAQYELARAYDFGLDVEVDDLAAAAWYRAAAKQGHASAANDLAVMLLNGEGVAEDRAQAKVYFAQAAAAGDTEASCNLGLALELEATPASFEEALEHYRRAAEKDEPCGVRELAEAYHEGEGVAPDIAQAIRLYRRAIALGDASAAFELALIYDEGEAAPVEDDEAEAVADDEVEGVRLYRIAAEAGHSTAQFNLGVAYDTGEGVERDAAQANRWYERAALQGDAQAARNLGLSYRSGDGVETDLAQAYFWLAVAAKLDDDARRDLATDLRRLSVMLGVTGELADAKARAEAFEPIDEFEE